MPSFHEQIFIKKYFKRKKKTFSPYYKRVLLTPPVLPHCPALNICVTNLKYFSMKLGT